MKRYILTAYYEKYPTRERTLANFIVTNPVVTIDGIYATSKTVWGGEVRHFYPNHNIVSIKEDN